MNGGEVRRLVLPRGIAGVGYDRAAVDELLDRVAGELDAGRPVAPLIEAATFPRQVATFRQGFTGGGGYDCDVVDGVLAQLRRQDDPAAGAEPWRDLPAWPYGMRPARDDERADAGARRDVGVPPGTQLSLARTGEASSELRAAGQPAHPLLAQHDDRAGLEVAGNIREIGLDDRRLPGSTAPASRRISRTDGVRAPDRASRAPKSVSADTSTWSRDRACSRTTSSVAAATGWCR